MTRAQYESLPLTELKAIAKARKLKGVSTLRKEELIVRMLEEDRKEEGISLSSAENADASDSSSRSNADESDSSSRSNADEGDSSSRSNDPKRNLSQRRGYRTNNSRQEYRTNTNDSRQGNRTPAPTHRSKTVRPLRTSKESRNWGEDSDILKMDSGEEAHGILEVMQDGYGFIRSDNFMPGEEDVYVSPSQIRKFGLKTGDFVSGSKRIAGPAERYSALLYINSVNGLDPEFCTTRPSFEDMTPIFPNERIHLERPGGSLAMRVVDLISPIGKGQRGMIVSPPKAGKTTLLKDMARSILQQYEDMYMIILLIDERPEEVTDIKETVQGPNVEVIYSTFDELPEHHRRVSEMVIERAKRLVEQKEDVIIFIDSITRLARAYNQVVPPSGRTLSGGLDPAALHMPKRFFGAARNMREGGSLTILATALVDTGSKMDDVVYEEFKGTGNMELVLDRKLQERRIFPAIDLAKSGTRREDLLLSREEMEAANIIRKSLNSMRSDDSYEQILRLFLRTDSNAEVVRQIRRKRML